MGDSVYIPLDIYPTIIDFLDITSKYKLSLACKNLNEIIILIPSYERIVRSIVECDSSLKSIMDKTFGKGLCTNLSSTQENEILRLLISNYTSFIIYYDISKDITFDVKRIVNCILDCSYVSSLDVFNFLLIKREMDSMNSSTIINMCIDNLKIEELKLVLAETPACLIEKMIQEVHHIYHYDLFDTIFNSHLNDNKTLSNTYFEYIECPDTQKLFKENM